MVWGQLWHKSACSAAQACFDHLHVMIDIATKGTILSWQQTTKVLIRLHVCAGWSGPLLFTFYTPHKHSVFVEGWYQTVFVVCVCVCGGSILFSHPSQGVGGIGYTVFTLSIRNTLGFFISWKGNDGNSSNFADTLISIRCSFIIENKGLGASSVKVYW